MSANLLKIAAAPVCALVWLGGQGTRAIAALVVFGIVMPPAGRLLKPYVTEAIFLLLVASFLRVDLNLLRGYLRRPGLVLAAAAWTMLAVPLISGGAWSLAGLNRASPDIYLALILQAVASPMMASPALAAVMGLDATLVLVTLVIGTALVPLTAPIFAYIFLGSALTLSPLALGAKLVAILSGSLVVASAIRWRLGGDQIKRHAPLIDGINVLVLIVFVSAVMENVAGEFLSAPRAVADHARLCGVLCVDWPHRADLPRLRLRACHGARPHGRATQHGADGGGDRWPAAGDRLAFSWTIPATDLFDAATAQADRCAASATYLKFLHQNPRGPPHRLRRLAEGANEGEILSTQDWINISFKAVLTRPRPVSEVGDPPIFHPDRPPTSFNY